MTKESYRSSQPWSPTNTAPCVKNGVFLLKGLFFLIPEGVVISIDFHLIYDGIPKSYILIKLLVSSRSSQSCDKMDSQEYLRVGILYRYQFISCWRWSSPGWSSSSHCQAWQLQGNGVRSTPQCARTGDGRTQSHRKKRSRTMPGESIMLA